MGNCCCNCANIDAETHTWSGTGLKYQLNMTCEGWDIDTDDWLVTITRGNVALEFTPENATHHVENEGLENETSEWYITIDTDALPPGECYITYDVSVPDDDFDDGVRHEIKEEYLCTIDKPKRKKQ